MRDAPGLGAPADALAERGPSFGQTLSVVVWHEPERRVPEHDERAAVDFLQAVLHVRHDRRRQEQRTGDLEQRGPLDRLDMPPEMTVVLAEIAEPSAARPRLDRHG